MMYDFLVDLTGSPILAGTIQSLLPLFLFILPFAYEQKLFFQGKLQTMQMAK